MFCAYRGLRNTFWSAFWYFVLSGRAFGVFLPEPLRFWLANFGAAVPLVYEAVFNSALKTGTSAFGFLEAIISVFVSLVQNTVESFNKKAEKKADIIDEQQENKKDL